MAKKKKKRKLKASTVWAIIIGYFIAGVAVAMLWLNQKAPDPGEVDVVQQGASNAWGLVPIIVIAWPIFLIWLLVEIVFF